MSYAYEQLRLAMQDLALSGSLHERLTKALTESLVYLRPKDLPLACRREFCSIFGESSIGDPTKLRKTLAAKIQTANIQEVQAMIQTVIHLYDTVTRYQPLLKPEASDI